MNILPGYGTTDLSPLRRAPNDQAACRGGLTVSQTAIYPDTAPEEYGAAVQAINHEDARYLG
ncbi:MAG: hypothetical protein ACLPKI_27155 [Streptosporangiaceae bacterium]